MNWGVGPSLLFMFSMLGMAWWFHRDFEKRKRQEQQRQREESAREWREHCAYVRASRKRWREHPINGLTTPPFDDPSVPDEVTEDAEDARPAVDLAKHEAPA